MRTWRRATGMQRCGLCDRSIPQGEPVIAVSLPAIKRELVRCVTCVGPAPPDLPALVERAPDSAPMKPLRDVARTVAVDFKARAAGD